MWLVSIILYLLLDRKKMRQLLYVCKLMISLQSAVLGTEIIAKVTSQCSECSLRFRMWDEDHHYGWVEYSPFSVADSLDKTLTLGERNPLQKYGEEFIKKLSHFFLKIVIPSPQEFIGHNVDPINILKNMFR